PSTASYCSAAASTSAGTLARISSWVTFPLPVPRSVFRSVTLLSTGFATVPFPLPVKDSNLDHLIQNQASCHWTNGERRTQESNPVGSYPVAFRERCRRRAAVLQDDACAPAVGLEPTDDGFGDRCSSR